MLGEPTPGEDDFLVRFFPDLPSAADAQERIMARGGSFVADEVTLDGFRRGASPRVIGF